MIKIIALDIGGVIAFQDYDRLTTHEKFLLKVYLNKDYSKMKLQKEYQQLILDVETNIEDIYSKLYVLMDHSLACLDFIKKNGYLSSLWTNNRSAINGWLKMSGIIDYVAFDYICNSCNMPLGINKPNPSFFRYALNQIHALPQQVLFIDDTLKNIESAKKLGIPSAYYHSDYNLEEFVKEKIKRLERKSL